jgi:uncharacterized protein with PIN domain
MTRLLLDAMLGRLRTYLRMCGHDTVYVLDEGIEADDRILDDARETDRTVVTRDRSLAARAGASILLERRDVEGQLAELRAAGLRLEPTAEPAFCGACNGPLSRVDPATTTPEYAPDPAAVDVWRCGDCGQHFWKGSHWDDVAGTLADLPAE